MVGRTIGHYRILGKIGERGMGIVYKGHDVHLARPVAVKVTYHWALHEGGIYLSRADDRPPSLIQFFKDIRKVPITRISRSVAAFAFLLCHGGSDDVGALREHPGKASCEVSRPGGNGNHERLGR